MSTMNMRMMRVVCEGVVNECAVMYGFNGNEALERMGAKMMEKKGKVSKGKMIPMPFDGIIRSECCKAVRMNHGLYTQCINKAEEVCSSCMSEGEKNDGELPYGKIEERIAAGSEFKDSKGRKPTPYAKVVQKLKLSKEEVMSYAESIGVTLDECELEMPVTEKKIGNDDGKRGRPKKSGKVIEVDNSEDLFAGLVQNSLSENEVCESTEAEEAVKADKEAKKAAIAAEKAEKAEKLAAEKAEKAEKLATEKVEKEAKKAALEAEKLAKAEKLAAEKCEKEAKKAALEAEKLEKKAALEAKKSEKSEKKEKKADAKAIAEVKDTDDEAEEISVKKFEINGKMYLKSNKNVLYDAENQDEIGVWNEAKQEIEFSTELEEEEEEE